MNPQALVAPLDPYGLPAPVWAFVFLLNLTLVLHFIAMGYVFGATLLHVPLAWAARPGSVAEWMLRRTEGPLPVALSFTITLGVAPLLFVQTLFQPVFYSASILIGYQWFGIVIVLMIGFYLIYVVKGGKFLGRAIPRPLHTLGRLAIFGAVLYVMVTQTANAVLEITPEGWKAVRDSGGNFLRMDSPLFIPRLLHNFLAAVVIGGVWMIALGARAERLENSNVGKAGATHLRKLGALAVLLATLLQILVGAWLVVVERPEVREMFFTGRPAAILWMSSLLGVLGLMLLGVFTLMQSPGKLVLALWGMLAFVLAGMFAAREAAREVQLAPYMNLADWSIRPQASSFALFAVLFVGALAVIGLMLKWLYDARPPSA